MKKIVTILGARPQFIKSSILSKKLDEYGIDETLIHTGQHFDANMSDIFFKELDLKYPKYNLNIHSLSHGAMTGRMIEGLEKIILKEKPDGVMVYGDTNSTLSGAIASVKLGIKLIHVESGCRCYKMIPEEINRILTDKISSYLFTSTTFDYDNLKSEKTQGDVFNVGDVMYDAFIKYSNLCRKTKRDNYILATIHREENMEEKRISAIFESLNKLGNVVMPIHPRTKKIIKDFNIKTNNIELINPVGYLDMISLIKSSKIVITDSGGVQKETYFSKKPSVIVRDQTEWMDLINFGFSSLSCPENIIDNVEKMINKLIIDINLFGDGKASNKIAEYLTKQ